jgi:hypothetical protein
MVESILQQTWPTRAKSAKARTCALGQERRAWAGVLGAGGTGIGAENISTPRATMNGAGAENLGQARV